MITRSSKNVAKRDSLVVIGMVVFGLMLLGGCSSSKKTASGAEPSSPPPSTTEEPHEPEARPEPSTARTYSYRVSTDGCNCDEFKTKDPRYAVEYIFRANYKMETGILTSIEIEVNNNTDDTLYFDRSSVKISSRNVRYQYNDKFLPLGDTKVSPHDSYTLALRGKEITDKDNWHKIAGEQLSLAVRGLRLGTGRELKMQTVTFIPENPLLGDY